jgi:hypothetical protein
MPLSRRSFLATLGAAAIGSALQPACASAVQRPAFASRTTNTHDQPVDLLASIRSSYAYLRDLSR